MSGTRPDARAACWATCAEVSPDFMSAATRAAPFATATFHFAFAASTEASAPSSS
jgi:hypothetical protein